MGSVIVLGAGMVGSVMAQDLARPVGDEPALDVTVADARPEPLAELERRSSGRIRTLRADLSTPGVVKRTVAPFDLVVGALSSRIAFAALGEVIDAGKNFCDISFMAEDPLRHDERARQRGVTCVVDCGVAPGMSHMLAGHAVTLLDRCDSIEIYVGGLPKVRSWPFEYKAAFSPADVIEEYTRPARLVEHGREVVREALSEPELMEFEGAGTLEAFNTDGLRSLVSTLRVPFMKEKTLRYPGHIEIMRVLRHIGLFGEELVEVGGVTVRPRDLTAKLMFPQWTYKPGERDITVMRVIAAGQKSGAARRLRWDLFDELDPASGWTSMARTTAFPCTIMARLVASGRFARRGVVVPEFAGQEPGVVDAVLRAHRARGIEYRFSEEDIEPARPRAAPPRNA